MKLNELEIIVISLRDSSRRISFAKKNMNKFKFSFFDAYEGKDKKFEEYFRDSDIYKYASTYNVESVIGCAHSHYQLWKYCLEKNSPILILEDDAIFMDQRAENFFNQAVLTEEFDVFFLDGKLVEEEYRVQSPYPHHSGTAYIMTPSGARKLMQKIKSEGFHTALDWEIINMQNRGLKCLSFNRVVIVPDATEKSQLRKLDTRGDLPHVLKHLGLNKRGAEIGVGDGNFSEILIRDAAFSEFYSIDSWSVDIYDTFYPDGRHYINEQAEACYQKTTERLSQFGGRSKIIRDTSVNASARFPDEFFDFVYIDADHTEEAVKLDLDAWFPKVRKGGMLAGHDYLDAKMVWENGNGIYSMFGVKTVVDNFVKEKDLKLILIEEKEWAPWHSWSFIK
jgi:GR25 family glycosyltransferase involved in LPS biosynthesis